MEVAPGRQFLDQRCCSIERRTKTRFANERNKAASFQPPDYISLRETRNQLQLLIISITDRDEHSAAYGELIEQWRWEVWRSSGDKDHVIRRARRKAERTIANLNLNIAVSKAEQQIPGAASKFREPLNANDLSREFRK